MLSTSMSTLKRGTKIGTYWNDDNGNNSSGIPFNHIFHSLIFFRFFTFCFKQLCSTGCPFATSWPAKDSHPSLDSSLLASFNYLWVLHCPNTTGSLSYCAMLCCAKSLQLCPPLWPHGLQSTSVLCPWDSPGKKTTVGFYTLLQGIFPTQVSDLSLLHLLNWQVCSSSLAPPEKPSLSYYSSLNWKWGFQ